MAPFSSSHAPKTSPRRLDVEQQMGCPFNVLASKGPKQPKSLSIKLEAIVCAAVFFGSMIYFIYVAYKYSDFYNYGGLYFGKMQDHKGLHEGWMFRNRMQDQNDDMWRRFVLVTQLGGPILYIGAAVLKNQVRKWCPQHEGKMLAFYYLAYAWYIHRGAKVLLLIAFTLINYFLSQLVAGRKYGPVAIWGYSFLWLSFSKSVNFRIWMILRSTAPIWGMGDVQLKLPFLSLFFKNISYGMDLHWARIQRAPFFKALDKDTESGAYKARIDQHLPKEYYTDILSYIQYQFYPALYIDGPVITFNDFMSQTKGFSVRKQNVFMYGLHSFIMLLLVDAYLHFVYAESIVYYKLYVPLISDVSKFHNSREAPTYGTHGFVAMIICNFLNYYLTHLVMWRIARFWALLDGIECPADFTKCIARCKNMQEIWRHWHASMTKWCTRYVYIPLGGSKGSTLSTCLNVAAVFTVTALWHNYDMQFALWGIMLSVFIAIEMVLRRGTTQRKNGNCHQISNPRVHKQAQPMSESTQRFWALVTSVPMFGFIIINMGTFAFGYDKIWSILLAFSRDHVIIIWITVMIYCNQRLVSIHDNWSINRKELKHQ